MLLAIKRHLEYPQFLVAVKLFWQITKGVLGF
jgi:hypothetical protein